MNILTTTSAPIIWLILIVVLIVAEVATYQLVAVWFALGAVASLLASLMGASGTVQLITFVVVSLLSLIASRPLVKKIQSAPKEKTNVDRIIGQTAVVIHPISSEQRGRVEIEGQDWSAAAVNKEESFATGQKVQIVRIEGVTVYVKALENIQ